MIDTTKIQIIRVLFVCIHNSARSQMAEAFLRRLGGNCFEVESAGLEPGKLNPQVVASMKSIGIDISHHQTKSVFDLVKQGRSYHYIITVCDKEAAERCPVFPSPTASELNNGKSGDSVKQVQRLHWSFPDPSALKNSTLSEEILQIEVAKIRDAIKTKILAFISTINNVDGNDNRE